MVLTILFGVAAFVFSVFCVMLILELRKSEDKRKRLVSIGDLEDEVEEKPKEKKVEDITPPTVKKTKKKTFSDQISPELLEGLTPEQRERVLKDWIFWNKG